MPWYDQYLLANYFVVTTMTTVGYGDNSAHTSLERAFCIALMVIGVIIFTYISGTLSSILQNVDENFASFQEKTLFLNKLAIQYNI